MYKFHPIRLKPGADLKGALADYARNNNLTSAAIVTCVGSLAEVNLRLASAKEYYQQINNYEIVSLVGTLANTGLHLHISLADANGKVIGGHLMDGNIIHTTAEIVIVELMNYQFKREYEPITGYKELEIYRL